MNKDKFLVKDGNRAEWGVPEGYPYKSMEETVIKFDGNTEGLTKVGNFWYKVSDTVFSDLNGCKITFFFPGLEEFLGSDRVETELSYGGAEGDLHVYMFTLTIEGHSTEMSAVVVIPEDRVNTGYEPGTYFFAGANGSYTESLTATSETIHPISSEFLPSETWIFTLDDGSTVTKKVAVGK